MHRGIDQNEKIKRDPSQRRLDSFGDIDLLNLRLGSTRKSSGSGSVQAEAGSSVNKFSNGLYRQISSVEPNPYNQPEGYETFGKDKFTFGTFTSQANLKTSSVNRTDIHSRQVLASPSQIASEKATFQSKLNIPALDPRLKAKLQELESVDSSSYIQSTRDMDVKLRIPEEDSDRAGMKMPVREPMKYSAEYDNKETSEILDPELNLSRLGYTSSDPIDWTNAQIIDKADLCTELYERIKNKTNADCKVLIGGVEFSCHLIVLQCYSKLFDEYVAIKKIEIPEEKCSKDSFDFIYSWMIHKEHIKAELNRENVLAIFTAAIHLQISDLKEQCWAFIDNIEIFCEDTAFLLYTEAKRRRLNDVSQLMLPRIQTFFLILVSSQNWLELDVEDVIALLTSNYVKINNEMEIFMSAIRWLRYDLPHREKHILAVLRCVRFGNIAPWQLIDIKDNNSNSEFSEFSSDPEIRKMIDDGLSYTIMKYWYNAHGDVTNNGLHLEKPDPRNWSKYDRTYFTYREFLIYLDENRRTKLIEKSKPKVEKKKYSCQVVQNKQPPPKQQLFAKAKPEEAEMENGQTVAENVQSMHLFLKKKKHRAERKVSFSQIAESDSKDVKIVQVYQKTPSITSFNKPQPRKNPETASVLQMFTMSRHQF